MLNNTHGIICSGIGSSNYLLSDRGSELKFAIDKSPLAYDIFEMNFGGDNLMLADVADIDYAALPEVGVLYAFPPILFRKHLTGVKDQQRIAKAVCDYAEIHRTPVVCVMSNDRYIDSEYAHYTLNRLYEIGYDPHVYSLPAQNYAVPSTRGYGTLVFTDIQMPISFRERKAKRGWYSSLVDIVDTFEEYRLTPKLWDKVISSTYKSHKYTFPVIVRGNNECQPYKQMVWPLQHAPMLSDNTGSYRKHLWVTDDMECYVFNTRAYARINTIPDSMIIPEIEHKRMMLRLVSDAIPYNLLSVVHNSIRQAYNFWEDQYVDRG